MALVFAPTPLLAEDKAPTARDAVVPISAALCSDMRSTRVLNALSGVGCERLRLVQFSHYGFDGSMHDGELVVLDAVADHVLQIFITLRSRKFPIVSVQLMNRYKGDDDASMARNNTSAFNDRTVAGSAALSQHAYGVAIDLNPVENPFIWRSAKGTRVSPPAGAKYVNRKDLRPGMAEPIVDVFAHHGFVQWGGYWRNPLDYQHFQIGRNLTQQLIKLPYLKARSAFEEHVARSRACIAAARNKGEPDGRSCAAL